MNMISDIENRLKENLREALIQAASQQGIDPKKLEGKEIIIEIPREKEHGDYASNLALTITSLFKTSPRQIAQKIVDNLSDDLIEEVSIAGPGFINFKLKKDWLYDVLNLIHKSRQDYGKINFGENKSVLLEFVSANPTGPLHVGHSRGAVVGDVLSNIMETAGFNVQKEYYINDAGNQIEILGKSAFIRFQQLCGIDIELPEGYYAGDYLKEIAEQLKDKYSTKLLEYPEEKAVTICRDYTYQKMLDKIKQDLKDYGVEFDSWFSEKELHKGEIKKVVKVLKEKGVIYQKEGATWFAASSFEDEKDRVVFKSDGTPTYLAADIAYHFNKLQRGYDKLINIWGADHHGYIPRINSVIKALDYDSNRLEVLIVQMVTLLKQGKKVSMSKRSGEFVTMKDVLEEVGCDAARYFYIMRSADSHLDFDLDLAKEESTNNPVYYVQYAHARIHSILEKIDESQFAEQSNEDLSLLQREEEIELMKIMARFPEEIKISAKNKQPHQITSYAYELANAFHVFYNKCRVITENEKLSNSRLYLVRAARQVLQNTLSILGIDAPCQM